MTNVPNWFVSMMGMGVIFFGLICLIALTSVIGQIVSKLESSTPAPAAAPAAPIPAADVIPNRQELVAAISVALAEELGEDVSAIRILSLKKVS